MDLETKPLQFFLTGNPVKVIYGAFITGTNWKFLTLEEKIVCIDAVEYYVKEVDKILGIILHLFREYLEPQNC